MTTGMKTTSSYIFKPKASRHSVATVFSDDRKFALSDLFYQRMSRPDSHQVGTKVPTGFCQAQTH